MMRALLCIAVALLLNACGQPTPGQEVSLYEHLGGGDSKGYARAIEPRAFRFPKDHGPHPGFRNEWWYVTGNLADPTGRRFGFQVTFFRIALAPNTPQRTSSWASRDLWMAHLALSDIQARQHHQAERFARDGNALAGASGSPVNVWLEDWRLRLGDDGVWRLQANTDRFGLQLALKPTRPPLPQGQDGLSRKSAEPGNASYYYSLTRMATSGSVRVEGTDHQVHGNAWLDREWSTSALAKEQAGWDWFALQLDDGRDLMYYRLRQQDGGTHPMSAGKLRKARGATMTLSRDQVFLQALRHWTAPDGRRYPVAWRMRVNGETLEIEAAFDEQQLQTLVRYWEGAVVVRRAGEAVGRGYLELAGY